MPKLRIALCATISIFSFYSISQSFNGSGGIIPDGGSEVSFSVNVTGLPMVADANFGFEKLCFNIDHTWNSDLRVRLVSPTGVSVQIIENIGDDSDNFTNTCFEKDAGTSVQNASGPFTGTFVPVGDLGMFNNGSNPNGQWKIYLKDDVWQDEGTLLNWQITFGNSPAEPVVPFTASELPIFEINTNGNSINDDPKVEVDLSVFWEPGQAMNTIFQTPHFSNTIGIEIRGSSSQWFFPKKGYGFEPWDAMGNSFDFPFLGFPTESDWILNANHTDKTLLQNTLTYQLFTELGHYAPRYKHAELLINDEYRGVYILMEKIKRDTNRVDIAKLTNTDVSGDQLTGGYLVKIDKPTGSSGEQWTSDYPTTGNPMPIVFTIEYPDVDEILPVQKDYIVNYVDSFEDALMNGPYSVEGSGWRTYADEQSFIDYMLMNELSKNVDGYRLSTYFHKDKDSKGGKITMGPVWDYDIAFGNAYYCEGDIVSGWAYNFNNVNCDHGDNQVPFWWEKLMEEDNLFVKKLGCRYKELRSTVLSTDYIFNYIDSMSAMMANAVDRNFEKWSVLGETLWPNPEPVPTDYAGEINELKNWIINRLSWLDNNMPYPCFDLGIEENQLQVLTFPNPVNDELNIQAEKVIESCEIYSITGQQITIDFSVENKKAKISTGSLEPGVYFVVIMVDSKQSKIKFVKE